MKISMDGKGRWMDNVFIKRLWRSVELELPRFRGHTWPERRVPRCREREVPYPSEFREQIVALARAGRSVEELAREFEPCAHTIHGWIRQAERDGVVTAAGKLTRSPTES